MTARPVADLPSGTIDLHVHAAPDAAARSVDALALARGGPATGLEGAVLKGHHAPTGTLAALCRAEVPGFLACGSVVLNHAVGGLNPAAVEALALVSGDAARVVFLPTRDAANDLARKRRTGAPVVVTAEGRPVPALHAVAEAAAARGLVLASGHLHPEETAAVFAALAPLGLALLATHVTAPVTRFPTDALRAVLRAGGTLELCARTLLQRRADAAIPDPDRVDEAEALIRRFGADRFVLSSDLGDPRYPLPAPGLAAAAEALARAGLPDAALEAMLVTTPRSLATSDRIPASAPADPGPHTSDGARP